MFWEKKDETKKLVDFHELTTKVKYNLKGELESIEKEYEYVKKEETDPTILITMISEKMNTRNPEHKYLIKLLFISIIRYRKDKLIEMGYEFEEKYGVYKNGFQILQSFSEVGRYTDIFTKEVKYNNKTNINEEIKKEIELVKNTNPFKQYENINKIKIISMKTGKIENRLQSLTGFIHSQHLGEVEVVYSFYFYKESYKVGIVFYFKDGRKHYTYKKVDTMNGLTEEELMTFINKEINHFISYEMVEGRLK